MKQTKFLLGACLALTLAGCSDEVGITADRLPVSGDEIAFGATAGQFTEPAKRTIYGVPDGENLSNFSRLEIDWVAGKDQVRVFCNQPSEQRWGDYTVVGSEADGYYLQKNDENKPGVRWGDDLTQAHTFYSFYPLTTSNGASISGLQDNSTVRATIPTAQIAGNYHAESDQHSGRTWHIIDPDMSYAMMVGTGTWTPGTDKNVALTYKPIVTVLDVYVTGNTATDYKVMGVGVRSDKQPIVGTFDYDAATDKCTYVTPESGSQDDNWAYIETVDGKGSPINIAAGQSMNVKFFLLPQDISSGELEVYVFLNNGQVLRQRLSQEGQGRNLVKGEIVKVLTPQIKPSDVSNWMSAIGNDVLFASQLSLPGTKHSFTYLNYSSESGTYNYQTGMMKSYQTLDIDQQFDMGIRAFNLKLNYANGGMYVYAGGANTRFTLSNLLDDLKEKLDATPSEFVVLTIDFVNGSLRRQEWLNEVCSAVDSWSEGHSRTDNPEDGSTENNDDHDYFRQITAETTVGVMRHGIAVVILMPESVGSGDDIDNAPLSYTSQNVNVVTNFGTSVQNTSIWHATMGSGRGQADIAVQNLEQNNSPASSVHAAGLGIYPYFITEKHVKEVASLDLIATKQSLVRELMLESFRNNNTAGADRVNNLYMNDLTGFCVVNNDDSRGWMTAERHECQNVGWLIDRWNWVNTNNSNLYDYRDVQNFDYVADWIRGEQEGVGSTADFSPARPEPDKPYEGQTSIRITGDHSFMGNGGNNALLASQMNPYAEDQIRRFVNDGRTPLGIVFMSFVGTDEVRFGNHTYNVQGNTLPALIVANNFKFALATSKNAQQGN